MAFTTAGRNTSSARWTARTACRGDRAASRARSRRPWPRACGARCTRRSRPVLPAVAATDDAQTAAARPTPGEAGQQIRRVDVVASRHRFPPAVGQLRTNPRRREWAARHVVRHDAERRLLEAQPLGLRAAAYWRSRPSVPFFVGSRHLAAIELAVQHFIHRRGAQPAGRSCCGGRGQARAGVQRFRDPGLPVPAAHSAKICRTTAACGSLIRRSTCHRPRKLS